MSMHWRGSDSLHSKRSPTMNPTASVPMFSSSRQGHAFGLVVAGAIFAILAIGGSGVIARNFVTAGSFAVAAERTVQSAS